MSIQFATLESINYIRTIDAASNGAFQHLSRLLLWDNAGKTLGLHRQTMGGWLPSAIVQLLAGARIRFSAFNQLIPM